MVEMEENMNDGKSYEFFSDLAKMYPADVDVTKRPWDYAMKLDDDAFLNIPNLLERLRPMVPRERTWFVRNPVALLAQSIIYRRVLEISRNCICMDRAICCPGTW